MVYRIIQTYSSKVLGQGLVDEVRAVVLKVNAVRDTRGLRILCRSSIGKGDSSGQDGESRTKGRHDNEREITTEGW